MKLRAALVFQGGGIRALFFPGHIVGLAKKGIDNTNAYSGTSGGALIAAGIWAGLHPRELNDFLKSKTGYLGLAGSMFSLFDLIQFLASWLLAFLFVTLNFLLLPLRLVCKAVSSKDIRLEIYPGCTGRRFERLINEMILLGLRKRGIHEDLISDFFGADPREFRPTFREVTQLTNWIRFTTSIQSFDDENYDILVEVYPRLPEISNEITFNLTDKWGQPRNNILDVLYGVLTAHDPYFPPIFISTCCVTDKQPTVFNNIEEKFLDVPIARIVRASAGHPIVFRPKRIKIGGTERRYCDGGLMLNFPTSSVGRELRRLLQNTKQDGLDSEYATLASSAYVTIGLSVSDAVAPTTYLRSLFGILTGGARDQLESELSNHTPYFRVLKQIAERQPYYLNFIQVRKKLIDESYELGSKFVTNSRISTTINIFQQKKIVIDNMKNLSDAAERLFPNYEDGYCRCHFFLEGGKSPGLLVKKAMTCSGRQLNEFLDTENSISKEFCGLIGLARSSQHPILGRVDILQSKRKAHPTQSILGLRSSDTEHIAKDLNFFLAVPVFDWLTLRYEPGKIESVRTGEYDEFARLFDSGPGGAIIGMLAIDGRSNAANIEIDQLSEKVLKAGIIGLMERSAFEISYALSKEIRDSLCPSE